MSGNDHRPHEDNNEVLSRLAIELAECVRGLDMSAGAALERIQRRQRRYRNVQIFLVLMTLVTAAVIAILGATVAHTVEIQKQSDRNSQRLEQIQERTGGKVLCPLFANYLAFEGNPPPPGTPQSEWDESFKVIREGYRQLECK